MRRLFPVLRIAIPALALFALALIHNLDWTDRTPFHRDESRWVGRAYLLDELRHPGGPTWDDSDFTRNQPPLGSYLMGLGLTLQGRDTDTTVDNLLYDFDHDFDWNVANGRQPAGEDMLAGRRTNAVVGALLAVTVLLIGWRLAGVVGGAVAGVVFTYNPLATNMASWAGADALLTLTIALAALTAIRLFERPGWGKVIVLGVLLGLGAATKLSPLFVAALAGAAGGGLLIAGRPWERGQAGGRQQALGWMLLTVPFTAFATFVATYPYLWSDPIERFRAMLDYREDEMVNQGDIPAMGTPGWTSIAVDGGLPDAISRTRFWLGEARTTGGELGDWLNGRLGWHLDLSWLDLTLGVTGIGIMLMLILLGGPLSRAGGALLILLGQTAVIWVGMRADFDRYQLPILAAMMAGVAVSAGIVAQVAELGVVRLLRTVRRRRSRGERPTREPRRWGPAAFPWRRSPSS